VTNYFLNSAWVFAPSIFWAVALAILYPLLPPRTRQSPLLALLGIVLTASCIFYLWTIRNSVNPLPSLPRTLAGVGWLLVALVPYRGRLVTLLAPIGRYSYGIFLVHPIFVASLQALARSLHISPAGWLDLLVVALAFPASALLTAFLASQRWTRWLVP
jgi:peptidoglycan/LPS O-acetylase OafA/YrhL